MKTFLSILLFLACNSVFAQVAIRSLGGSGTNLSLWGTGLSYPLVINNGNGIRVNDAGGNHVVQIDATGFTGNGGGLTNLPATNRFFNFGLTPANDNLYAGDGTGNFGADASRINNTAVGNDAMSSITSGQNNTTVGYLSMGLLTDGIGNNAFGVDSLSSLTSGTENCAFGQGALLDLTTSGNNSAFGNYAGENVTIGQFNTLLGRLAGDTITVGSQNVIIGASADVATGSVSNAVAIGWNASAVADNDFVLGTASHNVRVVGVLTGNGAGLTNLALNSTNITFYETNVVNFNGKVTINSNLFLTSVSYSTNRWNGPTNGLVLTTNYQSYVTTTDVAVTNVTGQIAGQHTWSTLIISNSSAAAITVRSYPPGIRLQGPLTTAALSVGAGKEAYLKFESRDLKSTNLWTSAQDEVAAFTSLSASNAYLTNVFITTLDIDDLYVTTLWATNAYIATNTAPVSPLTNLFVTMTRYTNANQRAWISQCYTGTAIVTLSVEQGNGITNNAELASGTGQLSMFLSPLARYTFSTNGTGGMTIITNTATWIGL